MPSRRRDWITMLGLAIMAWITHFWLSGDFGFYADDYTRIPASLNMSWAEYQEKIIAILSVFGGQGRPLHDVFIHTLAFLGGKLPGGIQSLYVLAYLIYSLNLISIYWLFKRVWGDTAGLLGSLAFIVYPADTTQAFLTHGYGLQTALLFLLSGFHLFLSDWKITAYGLVGLSLLTYETVYPLFLISPFLIHDSQRPLLNRMLRHALVMTALFMAVILLRTQFAEIRLFSLSLQDFILVPVTHMFVGPVVSLGTFGYRMYQTVAAVDGTTLIAIFSSALMLYGFIRWGFSRRGEARLPAIPEVERIEGWRAIPHERKTIIHILFVGTLLLLLAYPLTFTIRPYAISGRDTRVHFAAALGAPLIYAGFALLVLQFLDRMGWKNWGVLLISIHLSLMVGFGLTVQQDYQRSWDLQQSFWGGVLDALPGLEEELVILVEPSLMEDTLHIDANTWNLPRILPQLCEVEPNWTGPPRVYRLTEGWMDNILLEDGRIRVDGTTTIAPPSTYTEVSASNVLFLRWTESGTLSPFKPIESPGLNQLLSPSVHPVPCSPDILYPMLIQKVD